MSKLFLLCIACFTVLTGCRTRTPVPVSDSASGKKATYVLVHGAWGGGWDWKRVADLLSSGGNEVFRPTLTGQGEHSNLASTNIDLDMQIQDIVNVILWENLHDVVLVGHSYGGMIITGVADRVPGRIRRLVYVDALLPENAECVNDIIAPHLKQPIVNGFITAPWLKGNLPPPHDVLMPSLTFSEPITLTNQTVAGRLPATYILTVDKGAPPEGDDFYRFYLRAKTRRWPVLIMEGDHNVQRSHPHELAKLLEQTR